MLKEKSVNWFFSIAIESVESQINIFIIFSYISMNLLPPESRFRTAKVEHCLSCVGNFFNLRFQWHFSKARYRQITGGLFYYNATLPLWDLIANFQQCSWLENLFKLPKALIAVHKIWAFSVNECYKKKKQSQKFDELKLYAILPKWKSLIT